jgi:hypothetical protein
MNLQRLRAAKMIAARRARSRLLARSSLRRRALSANFAGGEKIESVAPDNVARAASPRVAWKCM